MENKKGILVAILGILSLVLVTVGVTYAFFNYAKLGTTDNSITSGTIEFLYTEVNKVGAGIKLENALPISDTAGKMQTGSGKVFNFKVTGKTIGNMDVPYEVTARMKKDSDLDPSVVKIYLTEIVGSTEKEILLEKYDSLTQTTRVTEDIATEKTLYKGLVPTGSTNYEKEFNLRMWVDEKTDYSPVEDEEGNIEYPYNNKTFTLTVNVYADAKVVTEEEIDMANTTNIETVVVNNSEIIKSDSTEYDYYGEVENETTEASIEVETTNSDATVEVTKLDNTTAYNVKSKIQRLSTTQTIKLQLEEGDNLFNIKVVSANKQVEDEYVLNIFRKKSTYDATVKTQTYTATDVGHKHSSSCNTTYKYKHTSSGPMNTCGTCGATWQMAYYTCPYCGKTGEAKISTCSHISGYNNDGHSHTIRTCGQEETITYTCPNGGTLSGSTCTITEYSCPNGGTLNGTICEK